MKRPAQSDSDQGGLATAQFADLYETFYGQVFGYVRRRVDLSDVDDLVGEVFLAAWRRIADAPPPAEALPWLYRIAYNVTGNHWRGRDRRLRLVGKLKTQRAPAPLPVAQEVETRHEIADVMAAVTNLRGGDAEILRLAHWEHLSTGEIAQVLGIPSNTAKQRLRRARERLKSEHLRMTETAGTTSREVSDD